MKYPAIVLFIIAFAMGCAELKPVQPDIFMGGKTISRDKKNCYMISFPEPVSLRGTEKFSNNEDGFHFHGEGTTVVPKKMNYDIKYAYYLSDISQMFPLIFPGSRHTQEVVYESPALNKGNYSQYRIEIIEDSRLLLRGNIISFNKQRDRLLQVVIYPNSLSPFIKDFKQSDGYKQFLEYVESVADNISMECSKID